MLPEFSVGTAVEVSAAEIQLGSLARSQCTALARIVLMSDDFFQSNDCGVELFTILGRLNRNAFYTK